MDHLSAMADTVVVSEQNERTAGAAAQRCLDLFNERLLQASSIHDRFIHDKVEDEVARFCTWIAIIGVFGPERASMDHRLRYAPRSA